MCRKLIFLTSLVVLLSCFSAANAGYELKVDIALNVNGESMAYTDKSQQPGYEDWIAWARWGADKETHDATFEADFRGTGITVGFGMDDGTTRPVGTVLDFTPASAEDDPICNTWLRGGSGGGPGVSDCHLVLSGPGLTPGTYWVYGYHNSPDGNEPNMPRVYVQTYSGFLDANIPMDNVGAPNDTDGGGVIVEANDVNVPVRHVTDDDLLEPHLSFVKFYTDGSPVKITYEAGAGSSAILNAFIIYVPTPPTAYSPFPAAGEQYACPDTSLTWAPGEFTQDVNGHNVYFGTDLRDELLMFEDNLEAGDANWAPSNWTIYDSNVLGDGNSDGNSHSFSHSFTPGSGSGTLTTVDINASEVGSMRVELRIKKTPGIEAGDIDLYYYDGSNWDFAADLNSIGANDVWLHYTDEVNESEYFVSTFKLQLRSDISAGELFIDDVSVTNTWPLGAKWFKGSYEPNNYDPPGILDINATYYWRIDEVNDTDGNSPWQGHTWNFTTEKGKARDPSPDISTPRIPLAGTTLSWTPSCLADYHDVYLGTDFDDVNLASDPNSGPGQGRQADPNYNTDPLVYNRKYFWRIDEVGQAGLFKGDVWSFQTIGYPLMHYTFDGVLDSNVGDPWDANFLTDDTGNVTFDLVGNGELRYDQPNPIYNPIGTSAHFTYSGIGNYGGGGKPLLRSCFGPDLLDLDGSAYTIEAWVRQDGPANYLQRDIEGLDIGEIYIIDIDGTILKKDRFTYGLGIDDDGAVKFMHNGQIISSGTAQVRIAKEQWYHIAAVYDACDPSKNEKLYINGIVIVDNNDPNSNPQDDYGSDYVGIGAYRWQSEAASHLVNHFNGAIDELRVVDRALTPDEFLIRGDPNLAWLPRPFHNAIDVQVTVDLEWEPGDYATSHEVYFGTNWYEVNDANNDANYWPDVYKGKQDPCTYELGMLDFAATYYWRIDEVNDTTNDRWKGNIWRFTIADFILIDNFDDDTAQDPPKFDWFNGNVLGTGASITLRSTPPVIGENSMSYLYTNFMDWDSGYGYYSEIQTISLEPNDWDYYDVRIISLWFYGTSGNDATEYETQMNLGLEDDSNYAVVWYGELEGEEINDVQIEEWQLWEVMTNRFTSPAPINFRDVKKVCIGFGTRGWLFPAGGGIVFFDEINLYPPICRSELNPLEGDFNGDCTVAWQDVEIMAGEWLKADVNFGQVPAPNDANLVGWWKLDDGAGSIVTDYASYDNNGVIETIDVNVSWVAAGHDGNALEFDGGRVRVPDDPNLRPMYQVSVSAWIKYSDEQDNARVVVKGAGSKETFQLEVDNEDDLVFYISDGNDHDPDPDKEDYESYDANSDANVLERDEWAHIAGTFDGNTVKCYVNGELVAESNDPNTSAIPFLCQDTNDLGIGGRPDNDNDDFKGTIDDVRIYNYGLSAEEVAYIATDGTGFIAVQSVANLYNDEYPGDRAVNLRDFAELSENWLVRKLWPE
ncbi:MAG: LamG domain-containing protein [Planctomycetota bacterium]|jgi:hypothetical protein